MKENILSLLEEPQALEKFYRENKSEFRKQFSALSPEQTLSPIGKFWAARLNYEKGDRTWLQARDLRFLVPALLFAVLLVKLPWIMNWDKENYFTRNIGFVVMPLLAAYFAWKNLLSRKQLLTILLIFISAALYINVLPRNEKSDTLLLACIHLPLFLWTVVGYVHVQHEPLNLSRRIDFLKYNGDLLVMSGLIIIAGGIMTGITIGLFSMIGMQIEEFYTENIGLSGLSMVPLIATYIIDKNPQVVNKISPLIARIFAPLVLVTMVIYLVAILYQGKDPFQDREFLTAFNGLLIAVMAIIVFSISESSRSGSTGFNQWTLLLLSIVTILVNGVALAAIVYRISEGGITPNRLAILGGNLLILVNLVLVAFRLFKTIQSKDNLEEVEKTIASFLPLYGLWALIVTVVFPLVFSFR